jgi:hypothetical protein
MDAKRMAARASGENGTPLVASFIIDAMTENKTTTPHFHGESATANQNEHHFAARVFGVEVICGANLVDGYFIYTTDHFMDKGSNLMVEIQRQALADLEDLLRLSGRSLRGGIVHLHFDNSTENKNKTMFFYLSMLVELEHFSQITVNFLMVGQTHSSIDQFFSQLSGVNTDAPFLSTDLAIRQLLSSHLLSRPPIICRPVNVYYDCVTAWKDEHYKYVHYNGPHVYRIVKRGAKACMEYMLYTSDKKWLPSAPRSKEIEK